MSTGKEKQTALSDRVKVAIEELKAKRGEIRDYELHITAISGVEVDASATWTVITGGITSTGEILRARSPAVKRGDFALRCLVERSEIPPPGHMKAPDSCKIQVKN